MEPTHVCAVRDVTTFLSRLSCGNLNFSPFHVTLSELLNFAHASSLLHYRFTAVRYEDIVGDDACVCGCCMPYEESVSSGAGQFHGLRLLHYGSTQKYKNKKERKT